MAHFYGTIQGARATASRFRLRNSDLYVTAQSFEGDIVIELTRTEEGDKVSIGIREHGRGYGTVLYFGLIKDLLDMEKRAAQMHLLGVQKFMEGFEKERDDAA